MDDLFYMRRALELAQNGTGRVSPNPLVGAVIVKDGRVIGEGWHDRYGGLHAERDALEKCREAGNDPAGAVMYVTLEPCCHHGKQPPCTDALIEAGIRRVVVGSGDPNPKVAGKGIRILREHGITVDEHVLGPECAALNDVFFHYIRTGRPLVVLKYAMTLDGKIAAYTGAARWVTGEEARDHVHRLRNRYSAILIGVNTVLNDDPLLTCRIEGGRDPLRIICDTELRTPVTSQVVRTAGRVPTLFATCSSDARRIDALTAAGCRVLKVGRKDGKVDLKDLFARLGEEGIDSVLVEGGAAIAWSAVSAGVVDQVKAYIAPRIFGGETAKTPVGGRGFPAPDLGVRLDHLRVTRLGQDILVEGDVIRPAGAAPAAGTLEGGDN